MSQRDNFGTGFVLGAIVGGVVGGIVGAVAASRRKESLEGENLDNLPESKAERFETEADIEKARRRLEDKISQLNLAIDDVRHQLGNVNGVSSQVGMSRTEENEEHF
jgi:hypothetical protein